MDRNDFIEKIIGGAFAVVAVVAATALNYLFTILFLFESNLSVA